MTLLVLALIVLGIVLAVWFALGVLCDHLTARGAVPERLAVHVLPGWLPSYVREDLANARQDRAHRADQPRA
ncbi:hypothetical protein [Streptomyces graminilatus]|uniref:hypothetical protein n=1 Tax=Streptomyces graminilatus TaxID=1464070 RepID=UPI0006E12C9E|nr:hypothetical protein [Streptomyces graminilatus]